MLPIAVALGALLAFAGALFLLALGAWNVWYASARDPESPELNAAFGAFFLVAGLALIVVAALASLLAIRLRTEHPRP